MQKNGTNPLATERISKLLPKYAIPSIISLLIGSLYNIVDQIFIGHGVGYLGNCATSILFPLTVIGLAIVLTSAVSNMLLVRYGAGSEFGSDIPIAVMGIVMKVFAIVISVAIGLAIGAQPILGFNYAAGNYKRVKATFRLITILVSIVAVIATVIFEFFPTLIIRIFGDGEPAYIKFAVLDFRIYLSCILFTCFQKISGIFLQALGKPVQSVIVSVTRDLVFQFPLMIILSGSFGGMGVLISAPVADTLAFIIALIFIAMQMKNLDQMGRLKHE